MGTEPTGQTNRPYAPPKNVLSILQRLRSRNLPDRVDGDYLRDAGISEGTVARTIQTLRFLGLLENDVPTEPLRAISTSTNEEYQRILAELIRRAYADVFAVLDPGQDSQDSITNFFRRYYPASQRDRMVVLFLGLCREAGIPTLAAPRDRTTRSSLISKPSRQSGRQVAQSSKGGRGLIKPKDPEIVRPGDLQTSSAVFGLTQDDIALLDEKEFNEVWTALGKVWRARARWRGRVEAIHEQKPAEPPNLAVASEEES